MLTRRSLVSLPLLLPAGARALDFEAFPLTLLISKQYNILNSLLNTIKEQGFFKNAGLNITISQVSSDELYHNLENNKAHLGLADMNFFIRQMSEDDSKTLKAIFSVVDKPPLSIVARKSRSITQDLTSLYDKTIGVSENEPALTYFSSVLKKNNIDESKIKIEIIGNNLREPMLASGEIDATLGSSPQLVVGLMARSMPQEDILVLPFADLGCLLYGAAVVTSDSFIAAQKDVLMRFNTALRQGFAGFTSGSDIINRILAENINTDFVKQNGLGRFDLLRFEQVLDQLHLVKPLKSRPRYEQLLTSDLL